MGRFYVDAELPVLTCRGQNGEKDKQFAPSTQTNRHALGRATNISILGNIFWTSFQVLLASDSLGESNELVMVSRLFCSAHSSDSRWEQHGSPVAWLSGSECLGQTLEAISCLQVTEGTAKACLRYLELAPCSVWAAHSQHPSSE